TIVIDFLHELNSFSSLTLDDLLKIADCSIELLEKALDEYDPNLRDKKENTREKAILRSKKMEKVDLHNEALNLTKKFYSHWSGLLSEDLRIIIGINFNSDQAVLRFQECCNRLVFAVSAVSLTLDDCDLICGTEKPFEVLANIFNLVHSLSSELLEAIEQQ
ncbi:MAG: hypothetical protein WCD44_02465, partial [Candidatus Babeliales bacterium]